MPLFDRKREATERRQGVRRPPVEESFYREVFTENLDGILVIVNDRVALANPAAESLLGYGRGELADAPFRTVCDPDGSREHEGLGADGVFAFRTARRRDGSTCPVDIMLTMVRWQGAPAIMATMRRATERLMAVNEYQRLRDEAIEASRLKAAFLANMSHEIRTPLNGIIGMTELLLDSKLDVQQREFVQTTRTCGENLLNLINDILDFSKIEAGRMELDVTEFNLRVCLEEVVDMLAARAHRKGLDLALTIDPGVPEHVAGDRMRLQQVLTNLLSNAVKFTETGSVVLAAVTKRAKRDQVVVEFGVTDTGIGIADADRDKLFQPFSQLDASVTRRFGGTGLGLAICRMLVDAMQGTIGVESAPGTGSVFRFAVPLRAVMEPASGSTRVRRTSFHGMQVLVLDPTELTRRVLSELLGVWGCKVRSCGTVDEARAMLKAAPATITFVDSATSGLDALSVAGQLAGGGHLVLITAITSRKESESFLNAGFAGFLMKPVRQALLHDMITEVMDPAATAGKKGRDRAVTGDTLKEARRLRAQVLLVEDDPVNQRVASLLLAGAGHDCDLASNGQEALNALSIRQYDLVLMDCQMPVMDGFTATRRIRETEAASGRRTLIVAMTANAMQGDRERCLEAGMDDYLAKPVQAKQLYDTINEHLASRLPSLRPDESTEKLSVAKPVPVGACDDEPLFDPAPLRELEALVGGADDALVVDMVRTFIGEFCDVVEAMRGAVAAGQPEEARSLAHTWESRTGSLGARRVQALCHRIQTDVRRGKFDGLARTVEDAGRAYRETCGVLAKAYPRATAS